MQDTVTVGTIAGIIGSIVLNAFVYLLRLLGINTSTPWDVAANVFLAPAQIHTLPGLFIGLIATLALGIGSAILITLLIKVGGPENAWLKGILVSNALGFVTVALMPPLGIATHIKDEPVTDIVALTGLSLFGIVTSFLIIKLNRFHTEPD